MTIQAQDQAAQRLVDALADAIAKRHGALSPEARAILLRVCGGHERRTVGLLSMAAAAVMRCQEPEKRNPFKWWLRK